MTDVNRIVIYKSNTGFTEIYALWIAEELNCDVISLEKIKCSQLNQYSMVIFGGGIHAGSINGMRFLKNNLASMSNAKLIVFATGATPAIPEEIERFRKVNIPPDIDIAFFYFQSGMNYSRMHGSDKLMMGMLKAFLKMKRTKSDVERGAADAIQHSYDCSDRNQITPLINYIRTLES